MKNRKKMILAVAAALLVAASPAFATETIDLTAVETGLTATKVAMLVSAAVVIPGALALMSTKWGGRWLTKLFKSFSS